MLLLTVACIGASKEVVAVSADQQQIVSVAMASILDTPYVDSTLSW